MDKAFRPLTPLWTVTAPALPDLPSFSGHETADVAIVGAGITGLSAALVLAERDVNVVVFDAHHPGFGTSGRAGGQVIAGLHASPSDIVTAYGADVGERMVEFSGTAPDRVFSLIERHGIECEAVRNGCIQATRSARQVKSLERLMAMWKRRGAPVEMLGRDETARLTGTAAYAGGWLDRRNGTIQPLAYVVGLTQAARAAGVRIYRDTNIVRLARRGSHWACHAGTGDLRAGAVLIASNAYTGGLVAGLKRSIIVAHSVQIATAPLSESVRGSILPERHGCSDVHLQLRYFRLEAGGRLVMGGPGGFTPPHGSAALSFRMLERSARRMFPQLADVPFAFHWFGKGALTLDMLPHLYEPGPGVLAALGYSGRGIAMGTALGMLMAERAMGKPAESLPFPTTPLSALPFNAAPAARLGLARAQAWFRRLLS